MSIKSTGGEQKHGWSCWQWCWHILELFHVQNPVVLYFAYIMGLKRLRAEWVCVHSLLKQKTWCCFDASRCGLNIQSLVLMCVHILCHQCLFYFLPDLCSLLHPSSSSLSPPSYLCPQHFILSPPTSLLSFPSSILSPLSSLLQTPSFLPHLWNSRADWGGSSPQQMESCLNIIWERKPLSHSVWRAAKLN